MTSVVWLVLSQSARETWLPSPRGSPSPAAGSGGAAAPDAAARALLARLKAGLRRLDVRAVSACFDASTRVDLGSSRQQRRGAPVADYPGTELGV